MPVRLRGPLLASGTVAALGALAVVALQLPSRPVTVASAPAPAPIVRTVTIHRSVLVRRLVHLKPRPAGSPPPARVAAPAPARAQVAPPAVPPPPRLRTRTSPVARGGGAEDLAGEAEHNDD